MVIINAYYPGFMVCIPYGINFKNIDEMDNFLLAIASHSFVKILFVRIFLNTSLSIFSFANNLCCSYVAIVVKCYKIMVFARSNEIVFTAERQSCSINCITEPLQFLPLLLLRSPQFCH